MGSTTKIYRHLLKLAEDTDKCQALDTYGVRCRKRAVVRDAYHGDSEIYSAFDSKPRWVLVKLCAEHDLE